MTLIKSLLLGSAAGIVAIASAQAADLPTKKGAPAAEYVRVCSINVNGKPIVGFTLPGSDTCMKLSGYITAQIEGGNLNNSQTLFYNGPLATAVGAVAPYRGMQVQGGTTARPSFGYTTRLNAAMDVASNTAYGPLYGHAEMQFENGNGFDNTGTVAYINLAYVTWAGITAGKAASFFSFTGGGPGWANFLSPDQQGFNQPDLLAHTASFGGGFSASVAIQSAGTNGGSGGGTNVSDLGVNYVYNGMRAPDVVGNLKVSQGWGTAQVSGVAHNVYVTSLTGASQNTWGWGIDAGISFNLPMLGPGDDFLVTGAWTRNAAWYSGIPDGMWGENGAVNGNGQQLAIADTYYNTVTSTWQTPEMWTISATADFHISPEFVFSPLVSYGEVNWNGNTLGSTVSDGTTWIVGGVAHWIPVKALDFELELLYQNTHNSTPNGFCGTATCVAAGGNPTFQSNADGFAARFEVTRSW